MKTKIKYPFIPEGRTIKYISIENPFIIKAREVAKKYSLDDNMPTASVLVKNQEIIHFAANGSDYHKKHSCKRVELDIPTGEGYELCEGCHPNNHSERRVIVEALEKGIDIYGSDLYLWGHWWCCKWCWEKMDEVNIKDVFLLKDSEVLFNKYNKNNIVGNQFNF